MGFSILIDSGSDLSAEEIKAYDLHVIPLGIYLDGEEYKNMFTCEEDIKKFYVLLRSQRTITTSLVNLELAEEAFCKILEGGNDLLFIGFSSGLSSSTSTVITIFEELKSKYPERNVRLMDSLCVSGGLSLMLHNAARMRDEGCSLDETYKWLMENRTNFSHQFTVDDLMFLHRGGRVSKTSAIAGTVLGIKPVLHVDDEGRLILVDKAKSRRKSLKTLVDNMEENGFAPLGEQKVFINHGDCIEDAKILADMVTERFGITDITIDYTAPVIGAHSGPGTVSLFFMGSPR